VKGTTVNDPIRLGIIGVAGRGKSFRRSLEHLPQYELAALCDVNAQGLAQAAQEMGVSATFDHHERMLDEAKLDAVIIGTPMPLHVPQSIAALERNVSVLSEVPAAVSVDECRALVQAAKHSRGTYMMAENYTYARPQQTVLEMVRRGLFGTLYYAEGEYLHELKELNEITVWRRRWQTGIDGITYGTHSLGPILQWFEGQRVTSVCCVGSGHHYRDARGDRYEASDTSVMLGRLSGGGVVKIRVDMLSDRPHAMQNYQLQGTDGCYESSRAAGEPARVWLRALDDKPKWRELSSVWDDYLPEGWRRYSQEAGKAGHGGGDFLEMVDFAEAVRGSRPAPIGIHHALDMTLPGLISQQSIAQQGRWLDVPDSRDW
jgi:predicted dehydrogenase